MDIQTGHAVIDLLHCYLLPTLTITDPPGRDLGDN
jgi:hypothetical protein